MKKLLPCGHVFYEGSQENAGSRRYEEPAAGDVGVCALCEAWWELGAGGFEPYEPTPEEREIAEGPLDEARALASILWVGIQKST